MTRSEFLGTLRRRLAGLPPAEIDDIVADYATHFADGIEAGRGEADIAAALGDPLRLARELRAEAGFKRWEQARTPGNFAAALFGFLALVAVDFVFLLPLIATLALIVLLTGVVMIVLCVLGFVVLVKLFGADNASLARAFAGIGLIASAIGGGALLLLLVDWVVRLLGRFARLHYALLSRAHSA